MKKYILIFFVFYFVADATAQQLPFSSQFSDNKFVWNPAFTASHNTMKLTGFFRQQWVSVDDAPRTIFAAIEYPFLDYNMSAGAVLFSDKTGPISKTGIHLMYNYKLRELIADDDQLSFGIQGMFSQFAFNTIGETYNSTNDPLISGANASKGFPTLGAGFAYYSSTEEYDQNTVFYFGAAMQQAYTSNLLVNTANFERTSHYFMNLGTRIYSYNFMYEPYVTFNYTNPQLLNYSINFNLEMEDTFWAGIGFANTSEISMQGGYILSDIGSRYTKLKFGLLANIFTANTAGSLGPGMEFYVSYIFNMD